MEIDEKYLKLLNLLIYDKRTKMSGIISDLRIGNYIGGLLISYNAFMNSQYFSQYIFIEDFENGNVVFLLPYGIKYMEKEMEEMAIQHEKAIKEFFGDKFKKDMIMRISEEDRQKEIRKWDERTSSLKNWNRLFQDKGNK